MRLEIGNGLLLRACWYGHLDHDPEKLAAVTHDQAFQRAIFLASPVFYRALEKKRFHYPALSGPEKRSLLKYYNRMSYRPTPFGAFSSVTALDWQAGEAETLRLADDSKVELFVPVAPDNDQWICLNPSIYPLAGSYRFIRTEAGRFTMSAVPQDPFYKALIRYMGKVGRQREEVSQWIFSRTGTNAQEWLAGLMDDQVLLGAELRSPISGSDQAVSRPLTALDPATGAGVPYCVTTRPYLSGGPGREERLQLESALSLLALLAPVSEPAALREFRKAFTDRFDQQLVPLLAALDPDSGISYGGSTGQPEEPLLGELPFPPPEAEVASMSWTPVHRRLLELLQRNPPGQTVMLSADDLAGLPVPDGALPNTVSLLFRKAGDLLVLEHAGGATATALVGRFTLFSDDVHSLVRELAALESAANPGVVFADIAAASGSRTDHVSRRRPVYDLQVPLNVYPGQEAGSVLPPSDLYLSVKDGELILYSEGLGRRVIPRLSSAYNYQGSGLNVLRLLGDLQYQGLRAALSLDPERFFPGLPHYPRIMTGSVVLSPAKWILDGAALRAALSGGLDELRLRSGWPSKLTMGVQDKQLVFDLSDAAERSFFIDCLGGAAAPLTVTEYLHPGREIRAGERPVCGQFTAFAAHKHAVYQPAPAATPEICAARAHAPGSDWLYLKIYCTPITADRILTEAVAPLITKFRGRIDRWFFIRYADPAHHLRLRFCGPPETTGILLSELHGSLVRRNLMPLISAMAVDTYRPEIERYSAELIGPAEAVFCAGSELALRQLKGRADRIPLAASMGTVAGMISLFLPDPAAAADWCDAVSASFLKEFRGDKALRRALDASYRKHTGEVKRVVPGWPGPLPSKLKGSLTRLLDRSPASKPDRRSRLLADIVHMQVNRTFPASQRRYELVIHYFLARHLRSLNAR